MQWQHTHTDGTLLPLGHFSKRSNILLGTETELASSFIKNLLDGSAFMFMLLAVLVLAFLIAIPNTLAPVALLEGITLFAARRTQLLGIGPIFLGGVCFVVILSFHRFAERHGTKLLSCRRCSFLSRRGHGCLSISKPSSSSLVSAAAQIRSRLCYLVLDD